MSNRPIPQSDLPPQCIVILNAFDCSSASRNFAVANELQAILPPKTTRVIGNHLATDIATAIDLREDDPSPQQEYYTINRLMFSSICKSMEIVEITPLIGGFTIMTAQLCKGFPACYQAFTRLVGVARKLNRPLVLVSMDQKVRGGKELLGLKEWVDDGDRNRNRLFVAEMGINHVSINTAGKSLREAASALLRLLRDVHSGKSVEAALNILALNDD